MNQHLDPKTFLRSAAVGAGIGLVAALVTVTAATTTVVAWVSVLALLAFIVSWFRDLYGPAFAGREP